jgi:Protein of unknown function (DUF3047)
MNVRLVSNDTPIRSALTRPAASVVHSRHVMPLASVLALTLAVALLAARADAAQPARQRVEAVQPPPLTRARPMPFSAGPIGATAPAGWSVQPLPKVKRKTRYDLVDDNGVLVLRARADNAAASLKHSLYVDPARMPLLHWRWRTQGVVRSADMTTKEGDDYAARLYVFFDRNPETMTLKDRTLLKVGRARYGKDLPTAALCYVWDNRQAVGTILPNAYTPFVAMVVASSGEAGIGRWQSLQRNIAEDYRRAFGGEAPQVTGVAVSVDTDNTGESTVSFFGDIEFLAGAIK